MTDEELVKKVMDLLNEAVLARNAGEKVCECGEIILDREKSAAAIEDVLTVVADYMIQFAIASDDPEARLHVTSVLFGKPAPNLH